MIKFKKINNHLLATNPNWTCGTDYKDDINLSIWRVKLVGM
jgi:hypothetical protein